MRNYRRSVSCSCPYRLESTAFVNSVCIFTEDLWERRIAIRHPVFRKRFKTEGLSREIMHGLLADLTTLCHFTFWATVKFSRWILIFASPPFAAIDRRLIFSRVRFFPSLSKWLRDALCAVKRTFLRIEGVSNLNLVGREGENINRWCFNRGALYRWKSGLRGRRTNGEKEKPKQSQRDIRARTPERTRRGE